MRTGNNTVLITGGTSGIGQGLAEAFLKGGDKVIICGRRQDRMDALAAKHPGLITRVCDVASAQDRRALHSWAVREFPDLNILINNAGVQLLFNLTKEVDVDRVETELETNLVAPLHLASLFAPHLAAKKESAILNISSGLAFCPIALMPVYCASKAAIHSLTISLRHQLRGTPVKVFEIIPPAVDSELGHERRTDKNESHGGMPVQEFVDGAMDAFRKDLLEAPIGQAEGLRANREAAFEGMNKGFEARYKV